MMLDDTVLIQLFSSYFFTPIPVVLIYKYLTYQLN